jgi:hypothetical protein
MNCSTSTIGMMTAVALLPDLGRALSPIPRITQVATPSRNTQAKVSHLPGSLGIATPKATRASRMSSAACRMPVITARPILPMK